MARSAVIRSARPHDANAILDLWRAADAVPSATDRLPFVRRFLRSAGDLLIATEGGRIVGTIIAGWDGWRGSIYRLAVLPGYRRRGIASALVRAAERRLRAKGAIRLSAIVARDESQATAFWTRAMGWKLEPRWTRFTKALKKA